MSLALGKGKEPGSVRRKVPVPLSIPWVVEKVSLLYLFFGGQFQLPQAC